MPSPESALTTRKFRWRRLGSGAAVVEDCATLAENSTVTADGGCSVRVVAFDPASRLADTKSKASAAAPDKPAPTNHFTFIQRQAASVSLTKAAATPPALVAASAFAASAAII